MPQDSLQINSGLILKVGVGLVVVLVIVGLLLYAGVRYVLSKPLPGKPPTPKTATTVAAYGPYKKWIITHPVWSSFIVLVPLVILFAGQTIWSGASDGFNRVTSETGVVEFFMILGFVAVIASFLHPKVHGNETVRNSLAILMGLFLLVYLATKPHEYDHSATFGSHLRVGGRLALWFLIPLCGLTIYLVKSWAIRLLILIPVMFGLVKFIAFDYVTSPKTVALQSIRKGVSSAVVEPLDVSDLRWEWIIYRTNGGHDNTAFVNELAFVRNDDRYMSAVVKLGDNRYRYLEWITAEHYGNYRDYIAVFNDNGALIKSELLDTGRFRFERRDRLRQRYYDGFMKQDGDANQMNVIVEQKRFSKMTVPESYN
jgi:hypothetical protein